MSKLLLVSSQDTVINFPKEEKANVFSAQVNNTTNVCQKKINANQDSAESIIFAVQDSLSELKSAQNKINFLSEELSILLNKS